MKVTKVQKIVINAGYGGYGLSLEAYKELGLEWDDFGYAFGDDRANPKLVRVIEKLGNERSSGFLATLKVVEIPDGIEWEIDDYDGVETIHEKHRSWR